MTNFNDKQIEILHKAEQLFAEEGFDGTSIRTIAKQANVNIAMISYYFGSKEKLLEALILYRTSGLSVQLDDILKADLPPTEKVERFVELYIARISHNWHMYKILHTELSSKRRIVDMDAFMEVKNKNLTSLKLIVQEGQSNGHFKQDINVALIPPTIIGTFFHFQSNRPYFEKLLGLPTDEAFESYLKNELTLHIKQTIKALLAK